MLPGYSKDSRDAQDILQSCSRVAPCLRLVSLDPLSCSLDVEQIPDITDSHLEKVLATPQRNFTLLTPGQPLQSKSDDFLGIWSSLISSQEHRENQGIKQD